MFNFVGMQHGVIMGGEPWGLSLEEKLLPQYLNEGGYESHIVGKVCRFRMFYLFVYTTF